MAIDKIKLPAHSATIDECSRILLKLFLVEKPCVKVLITHHDLGKVHTTSRLIKVGRIKCLLLELLGCT